MSADFHLLKAANRESLSYDVATNILGRQPGIAELDKHLARFGFRYSGNWTWRRAPEKSHNSETAAKAAECRRRQTPKKRYA